MPFSDVIGSDTSATLYRYPPCLSLPTADPNALAVECMLRFVGAHYVKRDGPLPVALAIGGAPRADARVGLLPCLSLIEASAHLDAAALPSEQRPLALCVEVLAEKALFPAFLHIIHADDGVYGDAVWRGVVPKVATVWQRLRGTYRGDVMASVGVCGAYRSVREAVAEMERGLKALEALHVAHSTVSGTFLFGTERPCSADALAYAAASAFFHADFSGHKASEDILHAQHRLKEECSVLVKYIEKLRMLYFEEYSSFYTLRATSDKGQSCDNNWKSLDDAYRKGRTATLVWTIGFTVFYFVMTNADIILTLLAAVTEEEEEEEEEGQADNKTNEEEKR